MTPEPLPRGTSATSETRRVSDTEEYAGWLTKQEAATAIRGSTKMVERLAADGQIQQASTQRQGRGAFRTVYHPDDVARIATVRRTGPAAFVLPAGVTSPVNGTGYGSPSGLQIATPSPATPSSTAPEQVASILCSFVAALRDVSETSETPTTVYLDVDQAAVFLNWTPRDLRRAIRAGEVPTRNKDRRDWRTWRIRRKDLEAL